MENPVSLLDSAIHKRSPKFERSDKAGKFSPPSKEYQFISETGARPKGRISRLIRSHARRSTLSQPQKSSNRAHLPIPLRKKADNSGDLARKATDFTVLRNLTSNQFAIDPFKSLRIGERGESYYTLSQCTFRISSDFIHFSRAIRTLYSSISHFHRR